jgi:hypothetical protein
MERLRQELREFLTAVGLSRTLVDEVGEWRVFLKLLVGVLEDVPLIIAGYDHLRSFRFSEADADGEPTEPIATWVIESPGAVFEGPVLVS